MDFLIDLLKIVFGFALIIGIHELGHAIAALLCGVKIKKFGIGMGPGWKIKNVRWFNELNISPIVIGGYVMMDEEELAKKSFWKRFFVYIAGMLANVLMAIMLMVLIGVNVLKAIWLSFYFWIAGWPLTISVLIQGNVKPSEAVSGPIGIGQMMTSEAMPYLLTIALINLALAMFNLLPLPPLDGGRIFVDILAKMFGKKIGYAVGNFLTIVGVTLLVLLLVYATGNDLSKIF